MTDLVSKLRKRAAYRLRRVKYKLHRAKTQRTTDWRIGSLGPSSAYPRGSADWLASCELEMGGYTTAHRNKISPHDSRALPELNATKMRGGDRMIHHGYADAYARHLARFMDRDGDLTIVECGILRGTGLALWSRLFPKALIVGLDIDPAHAKSNMGDLKARGVFGAREPVLLEFDQFAPDTAGLESVLDGRAIDIAVDDGVHRIETIVNTFEALRSYLAEDHAYFVEDNFRAYDVLRERYGDLAVFDHGELTVLEPAARGRS